MIRIPQERLIFYKTLLYKIVLVTFIVSVLLMLIFLSGIRELAYRTTYVSQLTGQNVEPMPFPISVDPAKKLIYESHEFNAYLQTISAPTIAEGVVESSWFIKTLGKLAKLQWYQNFASPSTKILVIQAGERREEIIDNTGDILGWNEEERNLFESTMLEKEPYISDGIFYPGTYTVSRTAGPEDVAKVVSENFQNNILARYTDTIENVVSLNDALTIASLLEREAFDFEDMRHIAGIIWNRLFVGMNLQLDASLQYSKANGANWWPRVVPSDKYIDSPFNTYKHEGLPPSPIANPTAESIIAALNPIQTDCMFYFHDRKGGFHCAETYEEHVALLKQHYGRGR